MIFDKEDYKAYDAALWDAIAKEEERQQNNIELIASENVVSKAVMAAQGSILTNKYAEGYPGRRYYGGTDVVDIVESLAIERAKEIFGAKFANVQPHSGSQANCAAYMALIEPGDTVMGNGSGCRWPFDSRCFCELLRSNLQLCILQCRS